MWSTTFQNLSSAAVAAGNGAGQTLMVSRRKRTTMHSSSSSSSEQPQDDDPEQLHRKRVAQILRYISTMQSAGTNGTQVSFVKMMSSNDGNNNNNWRRYGPFLQDANTAIITGPGGGSTTHTAIMNLEGIMGDDAAAAAAAAADDLPSGGGQVLFTIFDFQRLASLVVTVVPSEVLNNGNAGARSPSWRMGMGTTAAAAAAAAHQPPTLPFSFYTAKSAASAGGGVGGSAHRSLLGKRSNSQMSSSSSSSSDCCWLRLTRLTGADVPSPPPLSPPVMAHLQTLDPRLSSARLGTLSHTATWQLLETCLPLDRLLFGSSSTNPANFPTNIAGGGGGGGVISPKVQRWWRKYTYHRQSFALQRQVEPLYNHLFEWYHSQTQDANSMDGTLDLIWGLGQAQLKRRDVIIDGPLLEVRVEVELARDGALLVRPKEHAGVSLNRHVLAAISSAGTATSNNAAAAVAASGSNDAVDDWDGPSTNNKATTGSGPSGESSSIRQLRQMVEGLNASDLSPGQPQTYTQILKRMAVELSSGGTFLSSSGNSTAKKKSKRVETLLQQGQLVVTDAWCVYSAPRPSAVWARDAWVFAEKVLSSAAPSNNNMSTSAAGTIQELPRALRALTLGPGALDDGKSIGTASWSAASSAVSTFFLSNWFQNKQAKNNRGNNMAAAKVLSRPPFPLPTSDAQNRIADLLLARNYPAVVCEGPPGTGKTHTIANIVCAYLCQGKRVLVTSKGAPALSVLRERLPDCVQELCVDVSKSESSGMRQLQQTVERLANKVAWVNTERELGKSDALQENIQELEEELRSIDNRLGANAEEKREIVQTQQGQDLFESALELIEVVPWLMKTISTWDAARVKKLHDTLKALIMAPEDPMTLVSGFDSPPSDALISLAASKAGLALSYLKNATKEVFAKIPVLGGRMADHCAQVHEDSGKIRINGLLPSETNTKDWYLVFQRLKREKAIHLVCQEILEPLFTREGWPREELLETVDEKNRVRGAIISILEKAVSVKQITEDLELSSKLDEALEIERLDKRRTGLSTRIQALAEDLVAARVVAELSKNFSAEAQSALVKFAQVSGKAKFGKSTQASKMTQRQRRKRQEYLDAFEKCVRYIPCWILTSSQISDYLPSECLFDLVVIDEASQSDVTVLPGMLRGKQWLIVGDGKQVSPTESFVAEEQIEMLKAALPESPFEASMLPGHSFFDLCAQAFPMGRIILREHFRCAPEIIAYSNSEFYNGNLVPLRLPTSKERLKPSLVDIRIPNGRKIGKINERECDAIVNQIGEYIDSCTLLKKRSIGVISLVGDEQSRLIRNRLLDRVGPHKYKLHNILVGEPPSFQGAERDIVFLSMVCSPGSVITQSQLMHAQRVNVALSRARDRMVLVRSIDTCHIPNEQDVKFSVLDFFERARYAEEHAQADGALNDEDDDHLPSGREPTMSPFRARAENLLIKLLQEDGFTTLSMGIVWDNAICVEDAGGSGRRAAIAVEATGETQDDWRDMLDQQKSIERVGWKCMRVDAVSFLTSHVEVLAEVKKFLATGLVFPREKPDPVAVAPDALMGDVDRADDQAANQDPAARAPDPDAEENEDELVVISSDEENEDDDEEEEDLRNFGSLKPAGVPTPQRIKQEMPLDDRDGLGNGETAADYGNVADLGFLGAAPQQNDSEDDDDEDEGDYKISAGGVARLGRVVNSHAVPPARKRARTGRRQAVLDIDDDDDDDDAAEAVATADGFPNPRHVDPVARARPAAAAAAAAKGNRKQRAKAPSKTKKATTATTRRPPPPRSRSNNAPPKHAWMPDSSDLQEKQQAVRESTKDTFVNDDDLSVTSSSSSNNSNHPDAAAGIPKASALKGMVAAADTPAAANRTAGRNIRTSNSSSSSKSNKRRRLDKYSRDPNWYHRRSEEQDDISNDDYMEEVQPEPVVVVGTATVENRQQDMEEDDDSAKDQDRYDEELEEARRKNSDDESYRDNDDDDDDDDDDDEVQVGSIDV